MNICALATGRGGAIAVIRVSGPDSIKIVNKHFQSAKIGNALIDARGQSLHFGQFLSYPCDSASTQEATNPSNAAEIHAIDDVLVSVFRAPHSYTGENTAEISCHASSFIIHEILNALMTSGCRQAAPGEFTQRAFLNGKLDLSQAEAVADLIASTNAATHRIAISQMRGNFSTELAQLREKLLHLTTLMELELDFADHEELEFADRTELLTLSLSIIERIEILRKSFKTGQALKHGIPVAIVGKTNVGKSTLLNRLLHDDKAIVSDIHGTTRDVIEDTINIQGLDFRFIDTAGLRDTNDEIERIGIERTHKKMQEAAIIIHLADNPTDFSDSDIQNKHVTSKVLRVLNKIDQLTFTALPKEDCTSIIPISAKENINIDILENALIAAADIPTISENDIVVTSARHYEALTSAKNSLHHVIDGLSQDIPTDLLAEDLRHILHHLGEITGGTITSQEVLNNIWSHFCIGK